MGLTFTLTSFSCTAPFIGTLLVMAAGGDWQWPLVGMLAFSTVFALPFFVLALMPQWIASLPKSGGWLNAVKVLMAFLEIAAAMKFISNVDSVWGWGIFTRDVVLASWVVIFVLMAIYVLGLFRFAHEAPVQARRHRRVSRRRSSAARSASGSMTGLHGKPLGEIEAFLPPPSESPRRRRDGRARRTSSRGSRTTTSRRWRGRQARGKRVFVDFTGYTCTNCRWMEANMFRGRRSASSCAKFVLVRLYTDGEGEIYQTAAAPAAGEVQDGRAAVLRRGERRRQPVASFPGLTRDPAKFVGFLQAWLASASRVR